jgi:nucleoside-diphosphate-sugar epimerase
MQIAVVGPTGVLGRSLVPQLLKQGHQVRALARSVATVRHLFLHEVEAVECDLLEPGIRSRLPAMLRGCDAVAHIATAIPSDPNAPDAWTANDQLRTIGVRTLIDAALEAGVRRYLQQSITMVYPDNGQDWILEEMPLDSVSNRAHITGTIMVMEGMVRAIHEEQMQWVILRGAVFVGPGTFQGRLIENLRAGIVAVACDGRNYVSLIHVDDMAAAVVGALERAPSGSIFNVNADPIREGDYKDHLAEITGAPKPPRDLMAPCPPSWRCSNEAARMVLGWSPATDIFPTFR